MCVDTVDAYLSIYGLLLIEKIQDAFANYPDFMIFLTKIGDPRYAFLIYFPVTFCVCRSTGTQVLWLACLSEWINAVCKWIFHGDRPYWSDPTGSYNLKQFYVTCEIGPGSPSGHAMVTASVLYVMVTAFLKHGVSNPSKLVKGCVWCVYTVILLSVCVSRMFISAHFPHQVIGGALFGVCLAELIKHEHVNSLHLKHYAAVSCLFLIIAGGTFFMIKDPLWSIELAKKWCANPDWIHLDTSLFYSINRDISALIGYGVAAYLSSCIGLQKGLTSFTFPVRFVQLCASLGISLSSAYIKLPHTDEVVFYTTGFVKYFILMIGIVTVIPWCCSKLNGTGKKSIKTS